LVLHLAHIGNGSGVWGNTVKISRGAGKTGKVAAAGRSWDKCLGIAKITAYGKALSRVNGRRSIYSAGFWLDTGRYGILSAAGSGRTAIAAAASPGPRAIAGNAGWRTDTAQCRTVGCGRQACAICAAACAVNRRSLLAKVRRNVNGIGIGNLSGFLRTGRNPVHIPNTVEFKGEFKSSNDGPAQPFSCSNEFVLKQPLPKVEPTCMAIHGNPETNTFRSLNDRVEYTLEIKNPDNRPIEGYWTLDGNRLDTPDIYRVVITGALLAALKPNGGQFNLQFKGTINCGRILHFQVPPPTVTVVQPPPTPREPKVNKPFPWKKVLIVAGIVGVGGVAAYFVTRKKDATTNVKTWEPGWTPALASANSTAKSVGFNISFGK
jgi:hypothetical protein